VLALFPFDFWTLKKYYSEIEKNEESRMRKASIYVFFAFIVVNALILGGLTGCKKGSRSEDYAWVTIDENYRPQNFVEEFIKNDSEQKGIFPVYIKNYGQDKSMLSRFRGSNFARPSEAAVRMAFKGLEDWMLIDLRYNNEKKQEVLRTVLYVNVDGNWRVGDSGSLLK
jgi:hypothetical protein